MNKQNAPDFLHLSGWKTLSVEELENDVHVRAEITTTFNTCSHCWNFTELVKFGTRSQVVLDSPSRGKRVGIHFARQRYRCGKCGKMSLHALPDCDDKRRATNRLVRMIAKKSLLNTFTSVSREVGVNEKTTRNIFKDWVAEKDRFYIPITPEILGIDEIKMIIPRCVMTNIGERTIVDLMPKRNKPDVIKRLEKMESTKIKIVAIDMWRAYRTAAQVVIPKAIVVVDKFHVIKLANECLETVRKQVRSTLSEHHRLQLKDDRHLLRKRRFKLDDFEKLKVETWTLNFPVLGETYNAKERFYDFYECQTRKDAENQLREWKNSLSPEMEKVFKPILTALHNWREEILNYFDTDKVTNAYTESLNSLIRLISRNGRGYSFDVMRAKILYSDGARVTPKPVFDRNFNNFDRDSLSMVAISQHEEDYGASISTLIKQFEKEVK